MKFIGKCCSILLSTALVSTAALLLPACGSKEVPVDEVLGRPLEVDPDAAQYDDEASPVPMGTPSAPGRMEGGSSQ